MTENSAVVQPAKPDHPADSKTLRHLVFAQALLWVVGQLVGVVASGRPAPLLLAIWAAALAREARRPDPAAPRRVQNRLALLNGAFFLFGFVPFLTGRAHLLAGSLTTVFLLLYGSVILLHGVGWSLVWTQGRSREKQDQEEPPPIEPHLEPQATPPVEPRVERQVKP